jgi:Tol biopolymer transport system component
MTRITNDLNFYFGLSVDRDGRNIVSVQRIDENRLWIGDAADPWSIRPMAKGPNAGRSVDWTPDGRVVYDAYEANRTHIWIADPAGKNVGQLTASDYDDCEPRVSGDGRYIVFTSNRSGLNQVWRMDIDGSNQVLLAAVEGVTERPRFAADGQKVIFNWIHEGARTLAQVPVTGVHVEGLLEMPLSYPYYWAMSPDGKRIAYTVRDVAKGPAKVAIRSTSSIEPEMILDISPVDIFKWTPDGRGIIYRERTEGEGRTSKLLQIDVDSRRSKVLLTTEPESILDLSFSRDGSKIAVVRGRINSDAVMLTAAK